MAQLVARLVRNEKVGGSNPPSSTTGRHPIRMSVFCMPGRVGVVPVVVLLVAPHVLSCGPGCWLCPWAAARPRAVRAASCARRVGSKPGQALPPPTGTAAGPRHHPPVPQPGPAVPPAPSTPAVPGVLMLLRVVSKHGQAPLPPTGTAARPCHRPPVRPCPPVPPAPSTPAAPGVLACGLVRRFEARPGPATAHGHRSHAVLCLSALHIDESGCVRG